VLLLVALMGVVIFLSGCCSPSYVVKKIQFNPPDISAKLKTELVSPFTDLTKVQVVGCDTIKIQITAEGDTLEEYYQGFYENEKGDTIISVKFFTFSKYFLFDYRPDSIIIIDTVRFTSGVKGDNIIENIIWLISGLLTALIIKIVRKYRRAQ